MRQGSAEGRSSQDGPVTTAAGHVSNGKAQTLASLLSRH